jgi:hypothetical protein
MCPRWGASFKPLKPALAGIFVPPLLYHPRALTTFGAASVPPWTEPVGRIKSANCDMNGFMSAAKYTDVRARLPDNIVEPAPGSQFPLNKNAGIRRLYTAKD